MIVGSLLLILVAVAMLGLGLVQGSNAFLVGSIAASLLAAVALVVGARRAAAARTTLGADAYDGLGDDESPPARAPKRTGPAADRRGRESSRRGADGTVEGRGSGAQPVGESGVGTMLRDEREPDDRDLEDRDLDERDRVAVPNQSAGPGRDADLDIEDLADEDPPDEPAAQILP